MPQLDLSLVHTATAAALSSQALRSIGADSRIRYLPRSLEHDKRGISESGSCPVFVDQSRLRSLIFIYFHEPTLHISRI